MVWPRIRQHIDSFELRRTRRVRIPGQDSKFERWAGVVFRWQPSVAQPNYGSFWWMGIWEVGSLTRDVGNPVEWQKYVECMTVRYMYNHMSWDNSCVIQCLLIVYCVLTRTGGWLSRRLFRWVNSQEQCEHGRVPVLRINWHLFFPFSPSFFVCRHIFSVRFSVFFMELTRFCLFTPRKTAHDAGDINPHSGYMGITTSTSI